MFQEALQGTSAGSCTSHGRLNTVQRGGQQEGTQGSRTPDDRKGLADYPFQRVLYLVMKMVHSTVRHMFEEALCFAGFHPDFTES